MGRFDRGDKDSEQQGRLRDRYKNPHKHRLTYKIHADSDIPSRLKVNLSRVAAAALCAVCIAFSVIIVQALLEGFINIFTVCFGVILIPSIPISAVGIFHRDGLYYLRVYESETAFKPGQGKGTSDPNIYRTEEPMNHKGNHLK